MSLGTSPLLPVYVPQISGPAPPAIVQETAVDSPHPAATVAKSSGDSAAGFQAIAQPPILTGVLNASSAASTTEIPPAHSAASDMQTSASHPDNEQVKGADPAMQRANQAPVSSIESVFSSALDAASSGTQIFSTANVVSPATNPTQDVMTSNSQQTINNGAAKDDSAANSAEGPHPSDESESSGGSARIFFSISSSITKMETVMAPPATSQPAVAAPGAEEFLVQSSSEASATQGVEAVAADSWSGDSQPASDGTPAIETQLAPHSEHSNFTTASALPASNLAAASGAQVAGGLSAIDAMNLFSPAMLSGAGLPRRSASPSTVSADDGARASITVCLASPKNLANVFAEASSAGLNNASAQLPTNPQTPSTASQGLPPNNTAHSGSPNSDSSDPASHKGLSGSTADASPQLPGPPAAPIPVTVMVTADPALQSGTGASAAPLQSKPDPEISGSEANLPPTSVVATDAPPAPGPVHLAQIAGKAGQSEMHIGLTTSAFGTVDVHTIIHANDVGVVIGNEKGDLRSLLANELPGIAHSLQQQDLRLNQVSFQQGLSSSNNLFSGGNSQPRSFLARAVRNSTDETNVREAGDSTESPAAQAGNGRLSILA